MKERTIENPIIKDRVTFVRTSEETNGEYSEIVVHLSPGGGNEPHFHKSFSESFSPLEGRLGVLVGNDRKVLEPGETATIPPVSCIAPLIPPTNLSASRERPDLGIGALSSLRRSPTDWHAMGPCRSSSYRVEPAGIEPATSGLQSHFQAAPIRRTSPS